MTLKSTQSAVSMPINNPEFVPARIADEQDVESLNKIIGSATNFFKQSSLNDFCDGVISQIATLYGLHKEDIICAKLGSLFDRRESNIRFCGVAGKNDNLFNHSLNQLSDPHVEKLLEDAFTLKHELLLENESVLYFISTDFQMALYVKAHLTKEDSLYKTLQFFLSSISSGYISIVEVIHLRSTAYSDQLTHLPNRNDFINLLNNPDYSTSNDGLHVVLVDINHFSDINDGLGQDVGNLLLKAISKRLRASFHETVKLARIGADVFGFLGPAKYLLPNQINEKFDAPFRAGQYALPVSVSMGLCKIESEFDSGLNIIKRCNIALNLAKKKAGLNYRWYNSELESHTAWRLEHIRKLSIAYEQRKLQVWYQPQLDFKTKRIVGVEALLRWPDGHGCFIAPDIFVPLAEYSGLIVDMGYWVLRESLTAIKRLNQQGVNDIRVGVNVSIMQLRNRDFVQKVKDMLTEYDIEPTRLELEITENILMDEPQIVIESLHLLRNLGVYIAIDDFGTGFSSMSYLQKMPLNRLKIDRSFIKSCSHAHPAILAETVITLAQKLNLKTIAEGVEREEQAEYLESLGCDEVQGFLYAKPLRFNELSNTLQMQQNNDSPDIKLSS